VSGIIRSTCGSRVQSSARPQIEFPKAKFRAIVKMKKPWVDEWLKKPTKDMVLEAFAPEVLSGEIDDLFEIIVERVE